MKEIIDKLDFVKIKSFCSMKDNVKRMRRQTADWEEMFMKDTSIEDCHQKYTKNS